MRNINIPDRQKEQENKLVFSYMTLRNLIGFLGMLLPVALLLFTERSPTDLRVEPSISDYYYTSSGDILVMVLCILGVFLFTYKGYRTMENILSTLAALCGIGVAFSPTATKYARESFSVHTDVFTVPHIGGLELHLMFAAFFFILLSIISLVYFPKSDLDASLGHTPEYRKKRNRNFVFKFSGWMMLTCVLIMALYFFIPHFKAAVGDFPFIFTMETVAIEFFGLSWITKGETLWPDGEHYLVTFVKSFRKTG